jgi:hypothetical protein
VIAFIHAKSCYEIVHAYFRIGFWETDSRVSRIELRKSRCCKIHGIVAAVRPEVPCTRNTHEKADYATFYVSAIIFKGFPAIKSLGSF